jgi:hypothetical protein
MLNMFNMTQVFSNFVSMMIKAEKTTHKYDMRQFNVVYLCMTNERENFTDEIFLPIVLLSSMVTWLY